MTATTGQTHHVFGKQANSAHLLQLASLLKLEPQIHAGCLGFTVHLLLYSGLTWEERGVQGDTSTRDSSQLQVLQMKGKTLNTSEHALV